MSGSLVRTNRIPILDGWRGLAVALVLLGHFIPIPGLETARLGVELFFVLSGRLMAQILIGANFPIAKFYWRRFSRVVPALYCFVLVVWILSFFSSVSPTLTEYVSVLTFWSNYLFTYEQRLPLFGHTWSLAVEEHSYLALGLIAIICRRRLKLALACAFTGVLASWLWAAWLTWEGYDYYEIFWRSDTRAASILVGFCVHLINQTEFQITSHLSQRKLNIVILFIAGMFTSPFPDIIKYTLGTGLLACTLVSLENFANENGGNLACHLLQFPWLQKLGIISFSVYLYQQIFHSIKYDIPIVFWPLLIIASIIVGYLSYSLVEVPTRSFLNNFGSSRPKGKAHDVPNRV